MEREVSAMMRIGIMLLATSALIGIIMVTVSIGNILKMDAANTVSTYNSVTSSSQLSSLKDRDDVILPKAAIYSLLAQESSHIQSCTYNDGGNITEVTPDARYNWRAEITRRDHTTDTKYFLAVEDLLEDKLQGKASIYVTHLGDSNYAISIVNTEVVVPTTP